MEHHQRLGATYSPQATTFRLWAPTASAVQLRLYTAGSSKEGGRLLRRIAMKGSASGVYRLTVEGDWHGYYYDFRLHYRDGGAASSADPWAVACGVNGQRSMVVDLRRTDPEGWEQDRRVGPSRGAPAIWETHVHDFSAAPDSGVRPQWRGKYLAFTEQDTSRNGEGYFPTCVAYLKKLGITHVQLQPIADFATVDEAEGTGYNWGYDILNYNVPEGSYSTDPFHGEVRIRECKQMIQALHSAGIGVVLDVVYNHTYYSSKSWLNLTAPGAYYRHDMDGGFMNASGCGCETASERPPFRNYLLQSVRYWAEEYHVDGFRFDLMAIHDTDTMAQIRAMLDKLPDGRHILLYGEPWAALPVDLRYPNRSTDKSVLDLLDPRIGAFCDATRDTLVGDIFQTEKGGYSSGEMEFWMERSVKSAVCGWCREDLDHYIGAPSQTVQYVSCHDNDTLWDRLTVQLDGDFHRIAPENLQRQRLISGIYLTCAGMGLFQSGEEFCRTKYGAHNTYKGPAAVNQLDWGRAEDCREMIDWYAGLLRLRRELYHPLTRESMNRIEFADAPEGCVAFTVPCRRDGPWRRMFICYNPLKEARTLTLPRGKWQVLCDGSRIDLQSETHASRAWTCPPMSVTIMAKGTKDM